MFHSAPGLFEATNNIGGIDARFWMNFSGDQLPGNTQTVVVGNGAFAHAATIRPFIHNFLTAAAEADQPITVVTYEDPPMTDAYKPAQRVVTLGKVVVGAAELFGPVHLVGHSWSAVHTANVAAAFTDDADTQTVVRSLLLYTPIGYSGTETPQSFTEFAKRCCQESLTAKETSSLSLRTGAILACSAARRFARAPLVSIRAVLDALRSDQAEVSQFHSISGVDEKMAKLQKIPLKAVVAMEDAIFPPNTAQANLTDQGFAVFKISGNHQEAITNPIKGKELFRIMFEE